MEQWPVYLGAFLTTAIARPALPTRREEEPWGGRAGAEGARERCELEPWERAGVDEPNAQPPSESDTRNDARRRAAIL